MLGENHSLLNEFPEHQSTIEKLLESDEVFSKKCKLYNALDEQIRDLELKNSPIDDQSMQQLKHQRYELKDVLYQRLLAV